ncbi:two-component system, chemotaxis family, sensor kinase CheA [Caloramator quimbayensis]|uniref:Chemotaxis protein CheA n=1 Tax=Caloramator quimbayensis TaxID=1147123 RepID=A0A1T4X9I0_9CLOT|nr:chemotaxis protein CheA [Caloramator quimbayensis]SKA86117.1 two-component system, chemotaxis family, sensor kinase CheA [Caloramator quimbayensis]
MDMSQYLDMFLEESAENLQYLNDGILSLEKNPDEKETINSIFRAAHTLKGMAGSMGFTDIAELTHKMENVLDKFRKDELSVTSDVVSILFKCVDALENMINSIQEGNDDKFETKEIIEMLENIQSSKAAININTADEKNEIEYDLNDYDKEIIKQAKDKNYKIYRVDTTLYKDCVLKSARAFLVYKTLEEAGELIKAVPSIEDLEQEKFDRSFSIMLITEKKIEEIRNLIMGISEIEKVEVFEIKNEAEAEAAPAKEAIADTSSLENGKNEKEEDKTNKKSHQSIRVDIERLDKFMNLVGELVMHRTRLEQISIDLKKTELHETLEQVGRITLDLQDLVMKVRMLPIERVFNRFPRTVRDLSKELNKDIELIIEGEDTELDRTVIDEIGEPIMHLIRNAADHGIEPVEERIKNGKSPKGTIKLMAYQEGNKAVIRLEDDGKGLDIEKIKNKAKKIGIETDGMSAADIKNLIFMQGFSTSDKITDVSGRGVGMDVVKTKISSLGGTVDVISEAGKGTAFVIRLPLTLSIIQALLVKVGQETFAISLGFIEKVINMNIDDIKKTNKKDVIVYRDNIIPIVRLSDKLNVEDENSKQKYVVIVKVGEKTAGLLVDSLLGQQEIVIKPMGRMLQNLKEYVGATILGDGLVTLILNVAAFV